MGSIFLLNMCLAVIANQFSLTKQRENKRMVEEITLRNSKLDLESQRLLAETRQITMWADFIEYLEILIRKTLQNFKNKKVSF
jgi:hypothetical protein